MHAGNHLFLPGIFSRAVIASMARDKRHLHFDTAYVFASDRAADVRCDWKMHTVSAEHRERRDIVDKWALLMKQCHCFRIEMHHGPSKAGLVMLLTVHQCRGDMSTRLHGALCSRLMPCLLRGLHNHGSSIIGTTSSKPRESLPVLPIFKRRKRSSARRCSAARCGGDI